MQYQGVFCHTIFSLLLGAKKGITRDHVELGSELYANEMLPSKQADPILTPLLALQQDCTDETQHELLRYQMVLLNGGRTKLKSQTTTVVLLFQATILSYSYNYQTHFDFSLFKQMQLLNSLKKSYLIIFSSCFIP